MSSVSRRVGSPSRRLDPSQEQALVVLLQRGAVQRGRGASWGSTALASPSAAACCVSVGAHPASAPAKAPAAEGVSVPAPARPAWASASEPGPSGLDIVDPVVTPAAADAEARAPLLPTWRCHPEERLALLLLQSSQHTKTRYRTAMSYSTSKLMYTVAKRRNLRTYC